MTDGHQIRIYESELEVIGDETSKYDRTETGGSLFGLFSHGGDPTVFLATRATRRAVHAEHSLELDPQVTVALETMLWQQFGSQCLGMWHSHHWINLFEPSGGDQERARQYGEKYQRHKYVEIIANYVEAERSKWKSSAKSVLLTPFVYVDTTSVERADTTFTVLPGVSPLRQALTAALDGNGMPHRDEGILETTRPAPKPPAIGTLTSSSRGTSRLRRPGPQQPAATNQASGTPHLQAIHDIAGYFETVVDPLLKSLSRDYEAELTPAPGNSGFEVSVWRKRRHTRLNLVLAWDGSRPLVRSCHIDDGSGAQLPWRPDNVVERYHLPTALGWGIGILEHAK